MTNKSYTSSYGPLDNDATEESTLKLKLTYIIFISSSDTATLKLIVRAEVRKGYSPLIGAKVEVQAGSLPWKLMTDDGVGK